MKDEEPSMPGVETYVKSTALKYFAFFDERRRAVDVRRRNLRQVDGSEVFRIF
jgi:hypothetical protein